MTDYNALYETTQDALGAPYAPLMESIFANVPNHSSILDIGCGQGRDALALARKGYRVTGIDAAPAGISALRDAAKREKLSIIAEVGDITTWQPDGSFDVLLCDRTLHMLPKAIHNNVLKNLMAHVAPNGFVFLLDETSNMTALKETIASAGRPLSILREAKGDYFIQLDQTESTET
ncbi:MAG: class I SAM-dependent methyltransferase [Planktotalea sp.]|uniref:class I SAM-dependent methyltransferase n=1 Tax=Planktotalea sp. TaxID=2029877 RepID=UPI003C73F2CA